MVFCPILGQGTLPEQQVQQLYKMARYCLDRGQDIFVSARKEQRPLALFRLATPSPTMSPTLPNQPFPPFQPKPHPPPQTSRHASLSMPRIRGVDPSKNPRAAPGGTRSMDRKTAWSANQRPLSVASSQQVWGHDSTDGIPEGQLQQHEHSKPEQYRSQPIG
jgi:hypothetical protein